MNDQLYGFYSKQADQFYGHCFYMQNGKEIKVTNVEKNPLGTEYKWEDKVCLGKVDYFSRTGNLGYPLYSLPVNKS